MAFNESKLDLGFSDLITQDQVKNSDNLQLLRDVAKFICNHEINVTLTLIDKPKISATSSSSTLTNNKKAIKPNRDKSEAEIIQDALDVFGGLVIK